MNKKGFSIQDIKGCLCLSESAVRKLLNDSGACLDELVSLPGEAVSRETIINLVADQAGTRNGRKLAELLR